MTSTAPATDQNGKHTTAMRKGRQADSARRRQRVAAALERATAEGTEISASTIARAAGVDRSFLYRHRDLLEQIHTAEASPPATGQGPGPAVTRASLHADLAAASERATRLASRIRQPGDPPVRGARRTGLARIRPRGPRGHRRPEPQDQPPPAAGRRAAPATGRTRPGPRRRPSSQPRTHGPTQYPSTTPMTRPGCRVCTTPVAHATIGQSAYEQREKPPAEVPEPQADPRRRSATSSSTTMPRSRLCRPGAGIGWRAGRDGCAGRHNPGRPPGQRLSRKASSSSVGRYLPGIVCGSSERASARSLSARSACR